MRNKFVYSYSVKICASGFDELLESIFFLLLVVEAFSLQKLVKMLEEVVVDWQEVRWIWQPTPVLLPGESHGQRSLVGCSPWGWEESDVTERLHFHFSLSCTEEGNGNPLQCSCLENPRDGRAWWAAVYGVAQSWTRLERLSSIRWIWWMRQNVVVQSFTFWSICCETCSQALSWRIGPFLVTNAGCRCCSFLCILIDLLSVLLRCNGFCWGSEGIVPTQGSNQCLLTSPSLTGRFFTTSTTWEAPGKLQWIRSAADHQWPRPFFVASLALGSALELLSSDTELVVI